MSEGYSGKPGEPGTHGIGNAGGRGGKGGEGGHGGTGGLLSKWSWALAMAITGSLIFIFGGWMIAIQNTGIAVGDKVDRNMEHIEKIQRHQNAWNKDHHDAWVLKLRKLNPSMKFPED